MLLPARGGEFRPEKIAKESGARETAHSIRGSIPLCLVSLDGAQDGALDGALDRAGDEMNIAAQLRDSGARFTDRPAVALGGSTACTYGQMYDQAGRIAAGLIEQHGIAPGDRVALYLKNVPEYLVLLYAIWHAGAVAVPVNAKLHARECSYILDHSAARICFSSTNLTDAAGSGISKACRMIPVESGISVESGEFGSLLENAPISIISRTPDDLAWLFYTSGTTGKPKGAMLTHRNLMAMTRNFYADIQQISHEDAILHMAPLSHGSGLYSLPYIAKGAVNVIPESAGFSAAETYDLIASHPNSSMFLAPTMVQRMVDDPNAFGRNTGNLKSIIYGGGPMYVADLKRALGLFGPRLIQLYGQGEAPMTITVLPARTHIDDGDPRYETRLASVGVSRTDVTVAIVNEAGAPVAVGDKGEIVVSGDVVMAGYWNDQEATSQSLRDGQLFTGDVGAFDKDGYLTLLDRSRDVIISGGSNIYPREVEDVLLAEGSLLECSVVGHPHPEWGEEVVAFVVPREGAQLDIDALDFFCRENIARFKRPKRYIEINALPKNNYGKVLKTELRAILERETPRR